MSYTVAANRLLRIKVIVGPNAGDDMWFAYDTTSYQSRLTVG